MDKAYFITFEGIDGCGKTTAANRLTAYLTEKGIKHCLTREPGGTGWGRQMRDMLLHSEYGLSPQTETLLFAADRAEHMDKLILPALEQGEWVICDRFGDSTLAYQGGGRGLGLATIASICDFAAEDRKPDLTFYLALPYTLALTRRGSVCDRMEQEKEDFYSKTAAVYEQLAQEEPKRIVRIDANLSPDAVWEHIKAHIDRLLTE